jgi:hypothetical protein
LHCPFHTSALSLSLSLTHTHTNTQCSKEFKSLPPHHGHWVH